MEGQLIHEPFHGKNFIRLGVPHIKRKDMKSRSFFQLTSFESSAFSFLSSHTVDFSSHPPKPLRLGKFAKTSAGFQRHLIRWNRHPHQLLGKRSSLERASNHILRGPHTAGSLFVAREATGTCLVIGSRPLLDRAEPQIPIFSRPKILFRFFPASDRHRSPPGRKRYNVGALISLRK
jgi:hypothetical protein